MNLFRRLFRRKASVCTYTVAVDEEGAVYKVYQRGGQQGGILAAIQEKMIRGGNIYQIRISVKKKIDIKVEKNDLSGG